MSSPLSSYESFVVSIQTAGIGEIGATFKMRAARGLTTEERQEEHRGRSWCVFSSVFL